MEVILCSGTLKFRAVVGLAHGNGGSIKLNHLMKKLFGLGARSAALRKVSEYF